MKEPPLTCDWRSGQVKASLSERDSWITRTPVTFQFNSGFDSNIAAILRENLQDVRLVELGREQQLISFIRWAPPVFMLGIMVIMMIMVFQSTRQQTESELAALRTAVLNEQKTLMNVQVQQALNQSNYEQRTTESQLRENIQSRVREAHAIAESIYRQSSELGEAVVTERIKAALRPIRFNQGRGYFFVYKVSGETVLHPILPQNEGVNKIDLQDVRGDYIVRGMGEAVKAKGEAFYRWWFVKPEQQESEFEKIGFGKYFEPYDWFIGTGEYIVDVESDIQARLLERINSMRFANDGFVFVYEADGTVLAHANLEWLGTVRENARDANGQPYVRSMLTTAKNGGGFVEYASPFVQSGDAPGTKISYVQQLDGWNWLLGAGFYTRDIDAILQAREQELLNQVDVQMARFFALGIVVTSLLTVGSGMVGRRLGLRFEAFQARIESDFYELERSRNQLEYMALHDQLTGLPNRSRLHREIEQGIQLSLHEGKQLAILFVDLDDFKKINDAFGHLTGDRLLQKLGVRLRDRIQKQGIVSRFGGDEFIIALPGLGSLKEAEHRVEDVLDIFKETFEIDGKRMKVSASIGVAMAPADADEPDELITKADIVLYKSKADQKGRVLFYNQAINRQVQYDFKLERELRQALQNKEMHVVYQPQVDANTRQLIGVEALARWESPELGNVSPGLFIPLAEEIGLIDDIGRFVLSQALADFVRIRQAIYKTLTLSINISPKQLLGDAFVQTIESELNGNAVAAEDVILEITENVLIHDFKSVLPVLESLRRRGLGISLDDFGTGYSSLSYLSALPLSEVKIDQTFIGRLLDNRQSQSLVKAVLAIADAGNLHVVAEGVEEWAQAEVLAEFGCDYLQGYFFSAPLRLDVLISQYLLDN